MPPRNSRLPGSLLNCPVVLANSVGPDVVSTVDQALTELGFHQQALLGRITRRDGEIVIGRQREIIGHRHADTVRVLDE
jgi:hypothetical protein